MVTLYNIKAVKQYNIQDQASTCLDIDQPKIRLIKQSLRFRLSLTQSMKDVGQR